jgi:hypothetical protein
MEDTMRESLALSSSSSSSSIAEGEAPSDEGWGRKKNSEIQRPSILTFTIYKVNIKGNFHPPLLVLWKRCLPMNNISSI